MHKKGLLLLILLCTTALLQAQSPWTRNRAGFYVQAAWLTIPSYKARFADDGKVTDLHRPISENTFQLYGEYGLLKNSTLIVSVPWRTLETGVAGNVAGNYAQGSFSGIGNVTLGWRQKLHSGKTTGAFTLKTDLPTASYDNVHGLRTGYDNLTVLGLYSIGQGYSKAYWYGYGGYGLRSNDYADILNMGAEAGLKVKKVRLIAFAELVLPLGDQAASVPQNNLETGLFIDQQGYLSSGIKAIWEVNRFWGLNGAATGAMWAKNVPASPAFALGAWFKWE